MKQGEIQAMQERLQAEGYDVDKADGLVGFTTRTAVGQWQAKNRHADTCFPVADLIQALR